MIKQKSIALVAAIFCFSLCFNQAGTAWAQEKELTVAELIAKHLDSIGKPEVRANFKSRGITGKAAFVFSQGMTGSNSDGTFIFISEGKNLGLTMKFKDLNYPGEYLAYNGKETTVKDMTPGRKSPLADFAFRYNSIMKEGFLGGVQSAAWPLLYHKEGQPQDFIYKLEQIKDRKYHVLEKKLGDVKVKLFFDSKNFHHVRTEYSVRIKNDTSANSSVRGEPESTSTNAGTSSMPRMADLAPQASIHESEPDSIFVLIEKFERFVIIDGLSIPSAYGIEYSAEGHGTPFVGEWTILSNLWVNNGPIKDPSFFVAK
jgi:hypothetical protein